MTGCTGDRHDVAHTPFTMVVADGRVVYLHDRPLDVPGEREHFLRDLRSLAARYGR